MLYTNLHCQNCKLFSIDSRFYLISQANHIDNKYESQGEHLDGVTEEEECNDGWCEVEFRRGSEYPSIMRCVPGKK